MKISQLTAAEEQLMHVLWKMESGYMREVLEQYPEPTPHPNTVSTFLKILVEKEFLSTAKEGRIFRYTVAIPFEDYRKFQLENLLQLYYDNSAAALVHSLISGQLLTESDLEAFSIGGNQSEAAVKKDQHEAAISDFVAEITSPKQKKSSKKKKDNTKKSKKKKKGKK